MKSTMYLILFFVSQCVYSQIEYGKPLNDNLPKKFDKLRRIIQVHNFPKKIDPIKIGNFYYWKHNTTILCTEGNIEIIEYGAYLFYNDVWNLRKSYPVKELNKNFGLKSGQLKQAEPYTWVKNWRTDSRLFGGWAMWYFIGKTQEGETVCGYEKIETTSNLLN